MPIAYLDVPAGADVSTKRELVRALYDAMKEAYPFPDDHRFFIREWSQDSVSLNGDLGSEPFRPAFIAHVPVGLEAEAKRTLLKKINTAVGDAYQLPWFITFLHEHSLDLVAVDGGILAEDQQFVDGHSEAYS